MSKLETLLCKKVAQNKKVKCENTNVTVSMLARTEKNFVKRSDDLNID